MDEEGAICDECGTRIGPHGCCSTIRALRAEHTRFREALAEIVSTYGQVCGAYDICTHPACRSSYSAWALADAALREVARGLT